MEVGWGFAVSVTTVKSVRFGLCGQFVVGFAKARSCRQGATRTGPWPEGAGDAEVPASRESACTFAVELAGGSLRRCVWSRVSAWSRGNRRANESLSAGTKGIRQREEAAVGSRLG
jgi:hypothetical protein